MVGVDEVTEVAVALATAVAPGIALAFAARSVVNKPELTEVFRALVRVEYIAWGLAEVTVVVVVTIAE